MNIVFLIAKRFLISRNLFQGGMINIVSFLGLFIGAASIVLSIAVLNGFQNVLGDETKKLYGDYIFLEEKFQKFLKYFHLIFLKKFHLQLFLF